MDNTSLIQMGYSIATILVVLGANYFIKKDSKEIKSNLPKVEDISADIIKTLNEANKIDSSLFANSKSSEAMSLITNIVEDGLKKLDLDGIDTKDMDTLLIQASKTLADEFMKRCKTAQLESQPLG